MPAALDPTAGRAGTPDQMNEPKASQGEVGAEVATCGGQEPHRRFAMQTPRHRDISSIVTAGACLVGTKECSEAFSFRSHEMRLDCHEKVLIKQQNRRTNRATVLRIPIHRDKKNSL
jgi:hypothetical protein